MAYEIARWTTPTITFKPQAVEMEDIKEIFLTLSQGGENIITKGINDASQSDEFGFEWTLSQEDASKLCCCKGGFFQVDFLAFNGQRYTTVKRQFTVINSAINEEI